MQKYDYLGPLKVVGAPGKSLLNVSKTKLQQSIFGPLFQKGGVSNLKNAILTKKIYAFTWIPTCTS